MKKHIFALGLFVAQQVLSADVGAAAKQNYIDKNNTFISNQKQLTFVGTRSGEGYFSADATKMIYQSEREEGNPFYQMFVLDLKNGKSTRISTGSGMTTCGWLHPNLKKAMWSSTHLDTGFKEKVKAEYEDRAKPVKKRYSWNYDDQYDIFESDLNGKKVKRLTKEKGYDAEGSYSPDGKWIAFASNRSQFTDKLTDEEKKIQEKDPSYTMEIYLMKADGSQVKRLTHVGGYDGGPFFSADGSKITWRRFTPDGHRAEIYSMNTDGSNVKQLTNLNAMSWAPFFHPSGKYIVFASSVLGFANFELFIVDAEGLGKPVRITFDEGFDGLASFSPDGQKITWTHRNEKGESQIYIGDWNHELAVKEISSAEKSSLTVLPSITESDAKQLVKYLTSEDFVGRETGSVQEKIYTDEFARLFKAWGLVPAIGNSFVRNFEFTSSVSATEINSLSLQGRVSDELKRGVDYQILSYSKSGEFMTAPMVFAGYGIKAAATDKLPAFNSYRDLDAKGKWVVLLDYLPDHPDKEMKQNLLGYSQLQYKITVAKINQAVGVLIVSDSGLKELKFEGALSDATLPVLKISTKVFGSLLEKSDSTYKTYKALEADYSAFKASEGFPLNSQYISAKVNLVHNKSIGRNVIARLDPKHPGKNVKGVLIGAHGDHLGRGLNGGISLAVGDEKNQVHHGADDNASGVSAVLELAHYFSDETKRAQLKKPLYFGIWSGEELGVLGSSHFVDEWKTSNKKDFSRSFEAALNMDMIGRFRDKLQVQGVGSAKEWPGLSEEVALVSGLPLVLTSDPYLPTDSISFYNAGVPSISFFTGSHKEYHSPRDTFDTINFNGLIKVTDIVKSFTEKIATVRATAVKYEKAESSFKKMEGRSFRIYLGTIPDYSQEGIKGVRISGASKNSPAEKAGLKTGDVIVEFDRINIENLYDYVFALQSAKPNENVKIAVLREGKRVEFEIIPMLKE